jgi:aspartyl-tRNA(Asn)/glutamyl-tRNA(Gln) amidotransferase subunit A
MGHAGPVGRTVEDVAAVFDAIAADPTRDAPPGTDLRGLRLAVADRQESESIDEDVASAIETAASVFEGLGVELLRVEIPDLLLCRAALWTIASAEAAEIHHNWLETHAGDYHPVVRARLERGLAVSGAAYVRAQRVRRWVADRLTDALAGTDALLLPVSPITAYEVGVRHTQICGGIEEVSQAVTRYTPLGSITGRPAMAIPCGLANGLPVGLQLVGEPGGEAVLFRLGHAFQRVTAWHARRPTDLPRVGEPVGSTESG